MRRVSAFSSISIRLQILSVRILASPLVSRSLVSSQPTCARMTAVDNLQLGSLTAAPGQVQLRIEADYVTCTQ